MKHNYVPPLIPFIVLGLLWKFVTSAKLWTAYILPPPERGMGDLPHHDSEPGQLVEHAALSLMRVFIGFSCAFLLAAFLVTLSLLLPFFRKNEPWSPLSSFSIFRRLASFLSWFSGLASAKHPNF